MKKYTWKHKTMDNITAKEYLQYGRYALIQTSDTDVYDVYYVISADEWKLLGWVNTQPFDVDITECTIEDIIDSECFERKEK